MTSLWYWQCKNYFVCADFLTLSRKDLAVSQLLWALGFMNVSWEEDSSVEPEFTK